MNTRTVLISGAGIAGPTLAHWLHRYGFAPTVVEQAPELRRDGYVFHLHGTSGIEVLKRTGVWDRIRQHRRIDREMQFVDGSNTILAKLGSGAASDVEPSGAQTTIRRSDVALVLYEHTRNHIEYLFGDSLARLDNSGAGVLASFESGTQRQFDLVIGCDGLHSGVRRLAFGDDTRFKRYLGHYVAAFTTDDYPIDYGTDVTYLAPSLIATLFGLKDRRAIVVFILRQDQERGWEKEGPRGQKQALKAALPRAGWRIPELVERMQTARDFFLDAVSQVRMDGWSKGRIALVGDAAYGPTLLSGFGAQLALAGAYTLAGELMRAEGDHRRAYAAYEDKMRPYVTEKQKNPLKAAHLIPRSEFGLKVRQQLLKLAAVPLVSRLALKATYGDLIRESFTLTNYESGT